MQLLRLLQQCGARIAIIQRASARGITEEDDLEEIE